MFAWSLVEWITVQISKFINNFFGFFRIFQTISFYFLLKKKYSKLIWFKYFTTFHHLRNLYLFTNTPFLIVFFRYSFYSLFLFPSVFYDMILYRRIFLLFRKWSEGEGKGSSIVRVRKWVHLYILTDKFKQFFPPPTL